MPLCRARAARSLITSCIGATSVHWLPSGIQKSSWRNARAHGAPRAMRASSRRIACAPASRMSTCG
jgi:hypothetical protein